MANVYTETKLKNPVSAAISIHGFFSTMFFTVSKADKPVAINGSAKESDVTENIMLMPLVIFFC